MGAGGRNHATWQGSSRQQTQYDPRLPGIEFFSGVLLAVCLNAAPDTSAGIPLRARTAWGLTYFRPSLGLSGVLIPRHPNG
jgi:hypothetical protein